MDSAEPLIPRRRRAVGRARRSRGRNGRDALSAADRLAWRYLRDLRPNHSLGITRPVVGQKEPETDANGHFARGQGHRHPGSCAIVAPLFSYW
jgi:hypothetical protein